MRERIIDIRPQDEEAHRLWQKIAELAEEFGINRNWCLIGGLMVQLYAYEHEARVRPTSDIDVLADARRHPSMTSRLAERLVELGAELADPLSTDPNIGYQFEVDGQTVEILGPDGLKDPARTLGKCETIEVPGGSQALIRTETVSIAIDGGLPSKIRRPTLLGAILLKARALKVHKRREDQRQDLTLLLSFVEDPRSMAGDLRNTERTWLREAKAKLGLDDPLLQDRFSDEQLRLARLALEILVKGIS